MPDFDINCDCVKGWLYPKSGPKQRCPKCYVEPPKKSKPIARFKGVNKQSTRRKEIEKTHVPLREGIKAAVKRCDFCGTVRKASELEEHHIGRNRWREIDNPRRCAYVCRSHLNRCHDEMDALDVDEQIAVVTRAMKRAVQRVMR